MSIFHDSHRQTTFFCCFFILYVHKFIFLLPHSWHQYPPINLSDFTISNSPVFKMKKIVHWVFIIQINYCYMYFICIECVYRSNVGIVKRGYEMSGSIRWSWKIELPGEIVNLLAGHATWINYLFFSCNSSHIVYQRKNNIIMFVLFARTMRL